MFMELDQVAVDSKQWAAIKAGDKGAANALKANLHGMVLYLHALSADSPPYEWVSLRELQEAGVVKSITLNTKDYNGHC